MEIGLRNLKLLQKCHLRDTEVERSSIHSVSREQPTVLNANLTSATM
jgi:hypothetical protein